MPKVSIVVPTYNAEGTILETIRSVQQQTFSDFEIIIVNDGSTDQTLKVLTTVSDYRLKVFSYSNAGVSVARNRGMSHATGEFIAFLDPDDLWTPDKLELQLQALQQHPEAGVAYSRTYYMDEQGKFCHTDNAPLLEGNIYEELLAQNFLASIGSNVLIRKEAIDSVGEFDPKLTHAEDWEFCIRLAAQWPYVAVQKPQVFYRQSLSSASSKVEIMEQGSLAVIEQAFQAAPPELQPLKNRSLSNLYQFLSQLYLTRVNNASGAKQASQKLMTAIRLDPHTLCNKKTQSLITKLFLMKILSPRVANHLFKFVSRIRANRAQESNLVPVPEISLNSILELNEGLRAPTEKPSVLSVESCLRQSKVYS